jgi:hypothetical protein
VRRQRNIDSEIPDDEDDIVIVEPELERAEEKAGADADPDPLVVLRREVDEHKTARAEAERKLAAEKAERDRVDSDHQVNRLTQDKIVIEQAYAAAEARAGAAKRAFADAMKAGDFDAAAEAQGSIARTENEMSRYADAYQLIEERAKAPAAAQAPVSKPDTLDDAISRIPDPATRQWATDHKDDLADPKRLNLAYAADGLAVARGLKPGTDAYLDFLDEQLGYEMEAEQPPKPAPKAATPARRRAPPVAAPVTRNSGGKVSVTLTDTDKAFAQQLGVSAKEYARSIVNAKNDPRYGKYANRSR